MQGNCWLHLDEPDRSIALRSGDAVFLLRDLSYRLSDSEDADEGRCNPRIAMQPLHSSREGVGLVCGFFHFRAGLSSLIIDALPAYLILRADAPGSSAARERLQKCAAITQRGRRRATGYRLQATGYRLAPNP